MKPVFVDGPDGVGKTGYSKRIADMLDVPRLRMRPVDDTECIEAKAEVFNCFLRDLDAQGVDFVVDRGSVSSIVYSRVFDRGEAEHAWETLRQVKPKIVYLRVDPDELVTRYSDHLYDDETLREIAETFTDVMDEVAIDTEANVYTVDTTVGVMDEVKGFLRDDSGVT